MPQYYKDAFAKEHARIIGEGLGEFDTNLSISTETLDFDVHQRRSYINRISSD